MMRDRANSKIYNNFKNSLEMFIYIYIYIGQNTCMIMKHSNIYNNNNTIIVSSAVTASLHPPIQSITFHSYIIVKLHAK